MLAYDGAKQGMDSLTASARVRRFLFDYEDNSTADAVMRQIVPFWTWTSRNLPLQLVNIWANPRPYRIYTSFKNNLEDRDDPEPEPVAPVAPQPDPLPLTPDMVAPAPRYDDPSATVFIDEPEVDDDDDDMEPWEKYRGDLRYDANGDGVVDELDFPDWRSAGK